MGLVFLTEWLGVPHARHHLSSATRPWRSAGYAAPLSSDRRCATKVSLTSIYPHHGSPFFSINSPASGGVFKAVDDAVYSLSPCLHRGVFHRLTSAVRRVTPGTIRTRIHDSDAIFIRAISLNQVVTDRKSTRLNSSHSGESRMPSSA